MLSIRRFEPNDMFSVVKLASETLPERYNPNLFTYFYEAYPQGFIVAERAHKIIGFIIGTKLTDTSSRILMLSVNTNHRLKKVGTELLKEFEKISVVENIKEIDLEVRTDNTSAIKFYKKNSYKIEEKIEKFYPNGEDAYIMKKIL